MLSDYNVCDCIKHKSNVPCVCSTCEVRVYFFLGFLAVQIFKPHSDVVLAVIVSIGTCMRSG